MRDFVEHVITFFATSLLKSGTVLLSRDIVILFPFFGRGL